VTPTPPPPPAFTAEQQAAIDQPLQPTLIVAGAGSGKTTVMAARITALCSQVEQRHILGLTFSNKAAAHLRSAVVRSLGAESDVVISTYHGFGARLVNRHGARIGLPRRLRLLDHAQSLQLLYDVFNDARFVHRKTGKPMGILQDALQLSSRMSDHLVTVDSLRANCEQIIGANRADRRVIAAAAKRLELLPLIDAYRQRKIAAGLLDHDDQIALAYQLVSTHSDVAAELADSHRVVLLDEYQDTNFAQRRLLECLYGGQFNPALTAVGDDMQSIYAFRGAHLENLRGFLGHFASSNNAQPLLLSTSFRNDPHILELANRIQANVNAAQPKQLTAAATVATGSLRRVLAADSLDEANRIALHVGELISGGTRLSEIAVLCRKRKLIGPIVDALEQHAIPTEVIGLGGLLSRPEILEVRCWLEILGAQNERVTAVPILRLLMGPRYRIGLHDLAALAGRSTAPSEVGVEQLQRSRGLEAGLSDLYNRDVSVDALARLQRFVEERSTLQAAAAQLPLGELVDRIMTYTGLWQTVAGDQPMENLARFLHLADRFTPLKGSRSLDEFLNWLEVMTESETDLSEAVASDTEAVQVMTIHQSKGLEFDHVIIPGLAGSGSSQIFPDTSRTESGATSGRALPTWMRADADDRSVPSKAAQVNALAAAERAKQLEEEWRLLYVAVTRARHGVLFTSAHWYGDTLASQGPSQFWTWLTDQTDLVKPTAPDAPVAAEAPGVADRRRRQAQATQRREAEAEAEALRVAQLETAPRRRKSPQRPQQLGLLFAAPDALTPRVAAPRSLPVSAFVAIERCPRQFHWTHVRPMPRSSSAASILGTQVHSWIEQHGRRLKFAQTQPSLFDATGQLGSTVAPSAEVTFASSDSSIMANRLHSSGPHGSPDSLHLDQSLPLDPTAGLQQSFLQSRFGAEAPLHTELPMLLDADGLTVRGRIDAIYRSPHSQLSIVDFKTGSVSHPDDPGADVQLDLYGLAVQAMGIEHRTLTTMALHLAKDGSAALELERPWDTARSAHATQRLERAVARVRSGDEHPQPGPWCGGCPYADLCPEAQR
jgi:DNA helicase II / ATP-dependent DNA helicase PcrA